ncbi:MAG: response regulator [Magnetococcales bacterium]|nr:response regulator [Magnetococcales bacterium]
MRKKSTKQEGMRAVAEAQLAHHPPLQAATTLPLDRIEHELRVHQIELEMQNEELRRTQVELATSHDRYVDLYDFAPVGYFTLTDTGMIAEVNLTGAALLGVERNTLRRCHFTQFITHAALVSWYRFLAVVRRDGRHSDELVCQRLDKSLLHTRLDGLYLESKADAPAMVRITVTEIGERKQTEELRESNTRLTREIQERKRAEEALLHAKEQAEAATLAKSEFLSIMSHEIRTPMSVVLGMCEILAETELTAEQSRYTEMMRRAGKMLLGIINDILDFSRMEANLLVLKEQPFSPRAVLEEVVQVMQISATQKGLVLLTEVDADLPALMLGDSGHIGQVLMNLVGNAIKFTAQGQIMVYLAVHQQESANLLFIVSDTGIGIAPHKLATIFDRFTQANSSNTRSHGGSGLGLAISRKLVHLMGGHIWVESREGEGSIFSFTLPLRLPEPALRQAIPPETVVTSSRGLRILLAEDDENNQILFAAYLKRTPHQLTIVDNGAEAVARIQQEEFDLILMDLQMPVLDGYDATRQIRQWEQQEGRQPVIIIAISAKIAFGQQAERPTAAFSLRLTKPISKQDLLSAIQNCCKELP